MRAVKFLPSNFAKFRWFLGLVLFSFASIAWSGPPLVADDPNILETSQWELIFAIDGVSSSAMDSVQAPVVDLSYGVSPNTQISLVLARQQIEQRGEGMRSGWGETQIVYKWRFYNNESLQIAIAPNYSHAMHHSSTTRGLVEQGGIVSFPVLASLEFGKNILNAQIGFSVNSFGSETLDYSVALGRLLGGSSEVWLELWGVTDDDFDAEEINFRLGWDYSFSEKIHLLTAIGGPVTSELGSQEELDFDFYIGLQFFY